MEYGLLGEHLGHSFSKEIHSSLGGYSYDLVEIERDKLSDFIEKREFSGLNVTIPYKEKVIPHLDFIDKAAKEIGAVNTIVNRGGKLYGYNTDFFGMVKLFSHAKIDPRGRTVAILGTGGTSKTAEAVVRHLGAENIVKVSRSKTEGAICYDRLYEMCEDIDVIVNTTPVGMFPEIDGAPIDIFPFTKLLGVIDVVYNPLRTTLIIEARKRGIRSEGGLYMLVAQAARAWELFTGKTLDEKTLDRTYKRLLRKKENIVLIGMPASGKTTVGKILEKKLQKKAYDSDKIVEKNEKRSISEIFRTDGEAAFRDMEAEVIKNLSKMSEIIISTGGGSVLRGESVDNLKKNGKLYFIDRPLGKLIPTGNRPLANNIEAIENRYNERYGIYSAAADVRIDASASAPMSAEKIIRDLYS